MLLKSQPIWDKILYGIKFFRITIITNIMSFINISMKPFGIESSSWISSSSSWNSGIRFLIIDIILITIFMKLYGIKFFIIFIIINIMNFTIFMNFFGIKYFIIAIIINIVIISIINIITCLFTDVAKFFIFVWYSICIYINIYAF